MFKLLPVNKAVMINVVIDDHPVKVPDGSTVAAAVLVHGLRYSRVTPVLKSKRAPFCMMGVCYDCLMVINGIPNQRTCITHVREGMRIQSQIGTGPAPGEIING